MVIETIYLAGLISYILIGLFRIGYKAELSINIDESLEILILISTSIVWPFSLVYLFGKLAARW